MVEADLFHRMSEERLRARCLWGAVAFAASVVVPYEVIDNQPQFVWQLVGELPPAGLVGAFFPLIAAGMLLLARWRARRAASLALVALGAVACTFIADRIGSDAAAWGLLPLPSSFARRSTLGIIAMALTAAGSNLAFREATRRPARIALFAAVAVAGLFYLWPGRGESPGATVARNLSQLFELPTLQLQLGLVTLAVVALWPAIIALLGLIHLNRPPARAVAVMSMAAIFGFPLLLVMMVLAWYVRASPGGAIFGALGNGAEITAMVALLAAIFEVLGQAFLGDEPEAMPHGWPAGRVAATAGVAVVAVTGLQLWLARPPAKGVDWPLSEPTAEADDLFGERVVAWGDQRWHWDQRLRENSSAGALIEVRARAKAMIDAGREVDPALGGALQALARAANDRETPTRTWYRLVADVNAATRAAALPYYLDPRVSIRKTKEGLQRHVLVDSYRIEQVRRFQVDDEPFAMLHVRPLGSRRGKHRLGLLGFSRDLQAFALVVTHEVEGHAEELQSFASSDPPRCGAGVDADTDRAMRRCGDVLWEALDREAASLAEAAVAEVERHELQHQIDGPLLPVAVPVLEKLAAYTVGTQERVNRELSAYVAQLTAERGPLTVGLVIPLRFTLLHARGVYHHAGVLLLEALAQRRLRDAAGRVDRGAVADAYDALSRLDDAAMRDRARAAWSELFDVPLPAVETVGEAVAPRTATR